MSTTTTETPAWQQQIADQVAEIGITDDTSHLIVNLKADGNAILLDLADSLQAAKISAEDHATKVAEGDVSVVPVELVKPLIGGLSNDLEPETPDLAELPTGADEDIPPAGTAKGPDPQTGKLFEVPRVAIVVDETDPTVLKITFGGGIELERGDADSANFYNRLKAGKNVHLEIDAFVSSPKTTHRRDSEGNVDAVIASKSLIVHSVDVTPAEG